LSFQGDEFQNRVVVVTGSTRGLGLHLARLFADEGAFVGINGRDSQTVRKVCSGHKRFFPFTCDLLKMESLDLAKSDLLQRHGHIDYLICNAGGGRRVEGVDETSAMGHYLSLNFISSYNSVVALKTLMKREDGKPSSICVISSIASVTSTSAPIGYAIAKSALNEMVVRLGRDLAKNNCRINALALGNLIYPGSTWESKLRENRDRVQALIENDVPLRRFGTIDDVFNWCWFLGSNGSGFATGAVFIVDGGQASR